MTLNELEIFCDRWLASWTGNNPEKLIQYYSDDTFYLDPANPSGIKGVSNLLKYLNKLLKKYPDWEWKRKELIPTEKGFCLKWEATLVTGKTFEGVDIVEVIDSKISRNEVFFNPSVLLD